MNIEVTKSGKEVKVYHKRIAESSAVTLMLRCYAELIEAGFNIKSSIGFSNECQIIWCEYLDKPIGGICFQELPVISQAWINFSFTDTIWRQQGINTICHRYLENYMVKRNLKTVSSHVHVNNIARIKSCEKVGMFPEFYRMSKNI